MAVSSRADPRRFEVPMPPIHALTRDAIRCLMVFATLGVVIWTTAAPAVAQQPTPTKVQLTLYNAAQKEFDAGNFDRAAVLFVEIWRQSKTMPVALYNAARSYHLAGKLDSAEELYREYLALPGNDAAWQAKVQGRLGELQLARAEAHADDAARAEKSGNFALAVKLWAEALALNPKPAWVLKQARAEHLGGKKEAALKGYDRYLALPADKAPDQAAAARWRAELAPSAAAEPALGKGPATAPTVSAAPAPPARWAGWAALGGGVALIGGGVGLYLAQGDARAALDQLLADKQAGKVVGIDYASYDAKRSELNGNYRNAAILGGVGVVAAGVGAWLLARAPAKVAVVAVGEGLVVVGRF